uniref:Uncharacterized protein n=1 Tax=Sphaerodactylus townsendi TaxID=933632 RepID=A0ACB8FAB1_9SAUR
METVQTLFPSYHLVEVSSSPSESGSKPGMELFRFKPRQASIAWPLEVHRCMPWFQGGSGELLETKLKQFQPRSEEDPVGTDLTEDTNSDLTLLSTDEDEDLPTGMSTAGNTFS